jgi:hypothetical protein
MIGSNAAVGYGFTLWYTAPQEPQNSRLFRRMSRPRQRSHHTL